MKAVRRSRTSLFNDVLRNFLFKEIFKGCCLLFSYQGSCRSFLATALIFYQIRFALSRTFLFFCFAHPLSFQSASSDSLYRLSHLQGVVNSFFICFFSPVFSALPAPFDPLSCPRLFRLRVSGWHGFLRLFKAPSSATGAILSPGNGIVNVFSLFYLFQTIHTILSLYNHIERKRLKWNLYTMKIRSHYIQKREN